MGGEVQSVIESEHAIYCDECEELECVHCHDFNAPTSREVDEHAKTCPERNTGQDEDECG